METPKGQGRSVRTTENPWQLMKRFYDEGITAGVVTDCCGFGTAFVGTSNMRLAEEHFERGEFGKIARWMIGARKKIRSLHAPSTTERTARRLKAHAKSSGGEDAPEMDPWTLIKRLFDEEPARAWRRITEASPPHSSAALQHAPFQEAIQSPRIRPDRPVDDDGG